MSTQNTTPQTTQTTTQGEPATGGQPQTQTQSADDALKRTLQRVRQEARELRRQLKEAQRAHRDTRPQGLQRGQGGAKGAGRSSQREGQGQPRQRSRGVSERYLRIERELRREVDQLIQALPGERRGQVREAIRGMDVIDARNLLRTLGVASTSKPQGVGAFAAGRPKGTSGITLEELRKNPEKIKQLPAEQRRAILGQMGVRASDKVF